MEEDVDLTARGSGQKNQQRQWLFYYTADAPHREEASVSSG